MLDISACLLHIKNGFSIILWPGLFKEKNRRLQAMLRAGMIGEMIMFRFFTISMSVLSRYLYLGRLQIAFFSVSSEHQEQGAKTRNSKSYCKPEQRSYWCSWPAKNRNLWPFEVYDH